MMHPLWCHYLINFHKSVIAHPLPLQSTQAYLKKWPIWSPLHYITLLKLIVTYICLSLCKVPSSTITVKFSKETKPCNLRPDLSIWCQYLESMVDLAFSHSTSDIEEVCWHTSMQLYQIHSCHRQSSTVNCTPAPASATNQRWHQNHCTQLLHIGISNTNNNTAMGCILESIFIQKQSLLRKIREFSFT